MLFRRISALIREVNQMVSIGVGTGLADDQNFARVVDEAQGVKLVTFESSLSHSHVLRERPYGETYSQLREARSYHLRMLDGGLVQLSYRWSSGQIIWHRLAFLPSPDLESFQNSPDMYLQDELYADVMDSRVVTVPARFDFDQSLASVDDHPEAHLTLGQYKNCRIPVSAPLRPRDFMEFVLSSFYWTPSSRFLSQLPRRREGLPDCLSATDVGRMHLRVP